MPPETVPADDAATALDLARLLRGVEEEGREYVITRGGRPVARLVPERAEPAAPRRLTEEQERALAELRAVHAAGGLPMEPFAFRRDDAYDERLDRQHKG